MRFTLVLLLLFLAIIGFAIGDDDSCSNCLKSDNEKRVSQCATECKPYECTLHQLPGTDTKCYITWKVRNDDEALHECLELFPTTFVKGKKINGATIRCTIELALKCLEPVPAQLENEDGTFLLYDKCYNFPMKTINGQKKYVEGTISDYKNLCHGGKLSVFYSYKHAKFVGMKAKSLGIGKVWIGIDKEGRELEDKHRMIHSKLWKLNEGSYWHGSELKTFKHPENAEDVPAEAKYYFLRTITDNFHNRLEGSFERANDDVKASFACEWEAKASGDNKWLCDKLPIMGIDAVYSVNGGEARCLYLTVNYYEFDKQAIELKKIKGCYEFESYAKNLHSVGVDDGTGKVESYGQFKYKGKLRIAGGIQKTFETSEDHPDTDFELEHNRGLHIDGNKKVNSKSLEERQNAVKKKFRHYSHLNKPKYSYKSKLSWNYGYPKNEATDFGGSTGSTLGLNNGLLIDFAPELALKAVCSIAFFQECELTNPCSTMTCKNQNTYLTKNGIKKPGYFTCECPGPKALPLITYKYYHGDKSVAQLVPYTEVTNDETGEITCTWNAVDYCAWLHFKDGDGLEGVGYIENRERKTFGWEGWNDDVPYYWNWKNVGNWWNDKLFEAVVKAGCKFSVNAGGDGSMYLVKDGTNYVEVPCDYAGTLGGTWAGFGATSGICICSF